MAGLKCTVIRCGFSMEIPDSEVPKFRLPSAEITCPGCKTKQPAADCWIAYEAVEEAKRKGDVPRVIMVKGDRVFLKPSEVMLANNPANTKGGSELVTARR